MTNAAELLDGDEPPAPTVGVMPDAYNARGGKTVTARRAR
jgi:hypothetical protein